MDRSFINAVIGMVAVMLFGAFLILRPHAHPQNQNLIESILTVNMPRPVKEFFVGFSLEGRKLYRDIHDMTQTQKPKSKVTAKQDGVNGTQANPETKKTATEKARDEQKRRAYLQKQAELRAFRMRVIQESDRYRRQMVRNELSKLTNESRQLEYYLGQLKAANKGAENFEPEEQPEKEKLTADQWKSLVLSQPTQANILLLVEAQKNNEIDIDSFLQIAETLIRDNSEEKKKLGILALTSTLSAESFALAVKTQGTLGVELQKVLQDYLFSYNRPQGIMILDQVLKSTDVDVRNAAAQTITRAVEVIRSGQPLFSSASTRGSRGEASSTTSLTNYRRLLPTLQWLATNPSSGLTQWAQGLLSQLQPGTTPA